jgi:3',5'-cyclic AMP phosphodiesterase CpdA
VVLAHLSDLHLRGPVDLDWFDAQLAALSETGAEHLVVTGDLLDRWNPPLLDGALDRLGARGWLRRERATIIHGNHDIASLGCLHGSAARWRAALSAWDPPPLLLWRRRRFYERVAHAAGDPVAAPPFRKRLASGTEIVAIDSIPIVMGPVGLTARQFSLRHAIGRVRASDARWLRRLRNQTAGPRVLLLHHYPLATPPLIYVEGWVRVPMEIPARGRRRLWDAARAAGVTLVLCGHVHRARLEFADGIAVGLQGTSGGTWSDRAFSTYRLAAAEAVTMQTHTLQNARKPPTVAVP